MRDVYDRIAELEKDRRDFAILIGRDATESRTLTEFAQDCLDIQERQRAEIAALHKALAPVWKRHNTDVRCDRCSREFYPHVKGDSEYDIATNTQPYIEDLKPVPGETVAKYRLTKEDSDE